MTRKSKPLALVRMILAGCVAWSAVGAPAETAAASTMPRSTMPPSTMPPSTMPTVTEHGVTAKQTSRTLALPLEARRPSSPKLRRSHGSTEDVIAIGQVVEPFELSSWTGRPVPFRDPSDAKLILIVFVGTECPLVQLYLPKLTAWQEEFGDGELQIIAIDSNRQDSLEEMQAFARRKQLSIDLVRDPGNVIADRFGARRTPHAFLLDDERRLRYRGRIDDQYGVGFGRAAASDEPLRTAIECLLSGDVDFVIETEPVGCLIGRQSTPQADAPVTYGDQVSRILQLHCVECHREGSIGPFALDNYEDASGWASMIDEVIQSGRMPPWNADPEIGSFSNARGMNQLEKELISKWAEDGAPIGDMDRAPLPAEFVDGWRLPRRPDEVIAMSSDPFEVPAEGVVEYQYFVVDPGFVEDKWVTAAEVVPGNARVVHHAIVFYRAPDSPDGDHLGWIGAYVPGQEVLPPDPGQARRIPAGSRLIFQMHYTPNGQVAEDLTRIGLCFVDEREVTRELITVPVVERDFEIPPRAKDYVVEATLHGLPTGSTLLGVAPHMHLRGDAFELTLQSSDAELSERILRVPEYDFNWQHSYRFVVPIDLQATDQFRCVWRFDNSNRNLANPDADAAVRWGDQTWEEMAVAFFDIALPPGQSAEDLALDQNRETIDRNRKAIDTAASVLARFDANEDGRLHRSEVPDAFAAFAFGELDLNGDQYITEGELVKSILRDQD